MSGCSTGWVTKFLDYLIAAKIDRALKKKYLR